MKTVLALPETSIEVVGNDLYFLVGKEYSELATIYYFSKVFAVSAQILNIRHSTARNRMHQAIGILESLSTSTNYVEDWYQLFKNDIASDSKFREYYMQLCSNPDLAEVDSLKALRYLDYYKDIMQQYNYGDFHFKAMSSKFIRKPEASDIGE